MTAQAWVPREYDHKAVFYRDLDDYAAQLGPFLREGVERGEAVMVAVGRDQAAALREVLGPHGDAVTFVDMAVLGANPARILPAWVEFAARHGRGGRDLRGVGEPIWAGREPEEVVECQFHEALLNVMVDVPVQFQLWCPYDTARLPGDVLATAEHCHAGADMREVDSIFRSPLPEPTGSVDEMMFGAADLRAIRELVGRRAEAALGSTDRADRLVLVIHELATNSVLHGGGGGRLRVWVTDRALVCEVSDAGWVPDPTVGRLPPAVTGTSGRGLWMGHQLCDLLQVRSSTDGTSVRALSWLPR